MMDNVSSSRAISINPNYHERRGYDPTFLDVPVPLPTLSPAMLANAAENLQATEPDKYVLPYSHFSVVINKARRLAYYTAVNIDGRQLRKLKRETDRWIYDPRIPKAYQMGTEIYKQNPLDLGHLVRRLDPAWGETEALAKVANDDTFHFTNCSPQHKNLNQNKTTWAGLEDYILDNAIAQDLKVCVFSGPLFATDDPVYRAVQIPQQYWKVVIMVKADGNLSATAYLLDQSQLLVDLGTRGFEFGSYRMFQVTVEMIEQATGLQFDDLREHDPLAGRRGLNEVEITTLDMIQF